MKIWYLDFEVDLYENLISTNKMSIDEIRSLMDVQRNLNGKALR